MGMADIGGFADYNQSGMLNGGNTWSNNQYFMSDGGGRFEWGGIQILHPIQNRHSRNRRDLAILSRHEWLADGVANKPHPDTTDDPRPACRGSVPTPPTDPVPVPPVVTPPPTGVTNTIGSGPTRVAC